MNSKFVVALRTRNNPGAILINDSDLNNLIKQSNKLIKQCQKLVLENTEISKRHIAVSFNEIEIEEPKYYEILKNVSLKIDELIKYKFLNEKQLEDLSKLESQRDKISTIIDICSDTKGYLIELLAAYFPELTKDEIILTKIRELLPVWNNTRRQIEARLKQEPATPPPAADQEPGKGKQDKTKQKLTLGQIALKSVYEGLQITKGDNANQIAKENGHNSGGKLYQWFTYYSSTSNRKGKEPTPQKFKNKIELFESVIELLQKPYKQRAIDELNILRNLFENEF